MVRIVKRIQASVLPPSISFAVQRILYILIGSECITGNSACVAIAMREQRGNRKTDKKVSSDPLLRQIVSDPLITNGNCLPPCPDRLVIMASLCRAMAQKIHFNIVKPPGHKSVQLPFHLLFPNRMSYVKRAGTIQLRQEMPFTVPEQDFLIGVSGCPWYFLSRILS